MQRITITIDEDLLETVEAVMRRRGYTSRSEAVRDMIRDAASQEAVAPDTAPCIAVLGYVYDHETRALAQRLTQTLHHHHDLTVAGLHVHLDHDTSLEVSVLQGQAAAVDHALVVGGDRDRPAGPYGDSLQVLATGLFEKHGFRTIGLAAYPEPHPRIATSVLESMLRAKIALVRQSGMQAEVVTQFSFDAGPILGWLQRATEQNLDTPVRIGLAGPASIATLAKFAVRCGVGTSLLALLGGQTSIARLMVESGPERILRALAEAKPIAPAHGLHFFSFGGVAKTAEWMRAIAAGEFSLEPGDVGFRVNRR